MPRPRHRLGTLADRNATGLRADRAGHLARRAGAGFGLGNGRPTIHFWDAATGRILVRLDGHTGWVGKLAFTKDGRRLISAGGGREAVKLWDVGTRQELLTLGGTGSFLYGAGWSADGNVILAGSPWQAGRAPSWEEIAAAEAQKKRGAQR